MPSCVHKEPPSAVEEEQPSYEDCLPAAPTAAWVARGVVCVADLSMPTEADRGLCRCDACRARRERVPRYT